MDKINYKIRNLNDKDLVDVAELYTLFWKDSMDIPKMEQKFSDLSKNPNYIFLCAEENRKVIGTIQGIICDELYGDCAPFLVMENFVIAEEYRGKGIGRQLLNELEKIGKEKKCSQIIFITEADRINTVEFYERVGFNSTSHKGFKKSLE
ncbi:MAG: hypothetical protein BGO34_07555 [Bacteroidia bacterium 44-10]|nr:MAG: hypothetical protein BGO34_07555 [Bacteroidia bacterium 44-10]